MMRILLAISILLATTLAQAAVYRWVDDKGKVHYGDQPPAGAERLRAPPPPAFSAAQTETPAATPSPQAPDVETPFAKGKSDATAQERCDEFKARVQRYQAAGEMFIDNDDGTRHKMVKEERDKLIARTQEQADQACAAAAGR